MEQENRKTAIISIITALITAAATISAAVITARPIKENSYAEGLKEGKQIIEATMSSVLDIKYSEGYMAGYKAADNTFISDQLTASTTQAEKNNEIIYLGSDLKAYSNGTGYCEYSQDNAGSLLMGGKEYYYGFAMGTASSIAYAHFNLDKKYNTLSGLVGSIDGTNKDMDYFIYGDDKLLLKIDVKAAELPKTFKTSVKGVSHLKIQSGDHGYYGLPVGFANVTLT